MHYIFRELLHSFPKISSGNAARILDLSVSSSSSSSSQLGSNFAQLSPWPRASRRSAAHSCSPQPPTKRERLAEACNSQSDSSCLLLFSLPVASTACAGGACTKRGRNFSQEALFRPCGALRGPGEKLAHVTDGAYSRAKVLETISLTLTRSAGKANSNADPTTSKCFVMRRIKYRSI